jgi:hypothetical protein
LEILDGDFASDEKEFDQKSVALLISDGYSLVDGHRLMSPEAT